MLNGEKHGPFSKNFENHMWKKTEDVRSILKELKRERRIIPVINTAAPKLKIQSGNDWRKSVTKNSLIFDCHKIHQLWKVEIIRMMNDSKWFESIKYMSQ